MNDERLKHIRAIPGDATLDEIQLLATYAINAKDVRMQFTSLCDADFKNIPASWEEIYNYFKGT